jgi:hypothetical protein
MTAAAAGASAAVPQELVGLPGEAVDRRPAAAYLRATATNSAAGRDVELDYAARVLFASAFGLAVRRRFRPGAPIADIAGAVANASRRHRSLAFSAVAADPLEAEMLIRDALHEAVPIEGIPMARIVTTHVVMFASLVDELALTDDELDELIADADALCP